MTTTQQSTTPVPKYDLGRIFALRDKMLNHTLVDCVGYVHTGVQYDDLVQRLWQELPQTKYDAVYDSCRHVVGVVLTENMALKLCWRLAGNIARLRDGIAVPEWEQQLQYEFVPVKVLDFAEEETAKRKPGGRFKLRALAGTPVPEVFSVFWPKGLCAMIAARAGYTRFRPTPYTHMSELVGLRLMVEMDPKLCHDGRVGVRSVICTPSMVQYNKGLIGKRFRRIKKTAWPCPYGYDHACYSCFVGYDQCPAATHPYTRAEG